MLILSVITLNYVQSCFTRKVTWSNKNGVSHFLEFENGNVEVHSWFLVFRMKIHFENLTFDNRDIVFVVIEVWIAESNHPSENCLVMFLFEKACVTKYFKGLSKLTCFIMNLIWWWLCNLNAHKRSLRYSKYQKGFAILLYWN